MYLTWSAVTSEPPYRSEFTNFFRILMTLIFCQCRPICCRCYWLLLCVYHPSRSSQPREYHRGCVHTGQQAGQLPVPPAAEGRGRSLSAWRVHEKQRDAVCVCGRADHARHGSVCKVGLISLWQRWFKCLHSGVSQRMCLYNIHDYDFCCSLRTAGKAKRLGIQPNTPRVSYFVPATRGTHMYGHIIESYLYAVLGT